MYSKEFMKFIFAYQKCEPTPKKAKSFEIRFKNNGNGKLAKIFIPVEYK